MNQEHIKKRGEYCEKHDAFYNPIKDIWLEEKCGNGYLYCGEDLGYCVECLDKMEERQR